MDYNFSWIKLVVANIYIMQAAGVLMWKAGLNVHVPVWKLNLTVLWEILERASKGQWAELAYTCSLWNKGFLYCQQVACHKVSDDNDKANNCTQEYVPIVKENNHFNSNKWMPSLINQSQCYGFMRLKHKSWTKRLWNITLTAGNLCIFLLQMAVVLANMTELPSSVVFTGIYSAYILSTNYVLWSMCFQSSSFLWYPLLFYLFIPVINMHLGFLFTVFSNV